MKSICITIIFCTCLTLNIFSQQVAIQESFESLGSVITSLPYYGYKSETPPIRSYYFPTELINSDITQKIWTDVQLTQSIPNDYQIESLSRRLDPGIENFWIGVVTTGIADIAKKVLLTVSPEGEFIDAIDVWVRGSHGIENYIYVMQWKIDRNMKVTTYRIKPTQTTPIPWDNQESSFFGQRIDTEYQVSPQGKFVKLNEIKYAPKTYTYSYLADENSNFWDGNEIPESFGKKKPGDLDIEAK